MARQLRTLLPVLRGSRRLLEREPEDGAAAGAPSSARPPGLSLIGPDQKILQLLIAPETVQEKWDSKLHP